MRPEVRQHQFRVAQSCCSVHRDVNGLGRVIVERQVVAFDYPTHDDSSDPFVAVEEWLTLDDCHESVCDSEKTNLGLLVWTRPDEFVDPVYRVEH